MGKFVNPFTDVGFKRIFGQDVSKPVLLALENHTVFSDKVRLIYLQLPYFTKETDECDSIFEKIIYTLKHMDILERMPWMAQNAVFKRLSEIAEVASLNKDERRKYDESLRAYRDTIAVMNGQFQQGEQKGRVEGRAEGRAEGNIEGRTEERFDIARKMKQKGMAAEVIADITSLTAKEIEEL